MRHIPSTHFHLYVLFVLTQKLQLVLSWSCSFANNQAMQLEVLGDMMFMDNRGVGISLAQQLNEQSVQCGHIANGLEVQAEEEPATQSVAYVLICLI
jgi:hypothetical protein